MVSMRALPFKDKNITFRNTSRIDSSECTLMNTVLYLNSYQKVLLNTKIKLLMKIIGIILLNIVILEQ